jgi:hypothetical protein
MASVWKKILPYAAGALTGGVSNQFSALKPFSAALSAGAGALANKDNRLQGALQGFVGGGAGSALGAGLSGFFGKQGTNAVSNFGNNAWSGLQSYGSSIPGMKGVGTANPTGALAKFFSPAAQTPSSSMTSGIQNKSLVPGRSTSPLLATSLGAERRAASLPTSLSGFSAGLPSTASATPTVFQQASNIMPQAAGKVNPMEAFKNVIPGAAISMLGGIMSPGPTSSPDYSGIASDLRSQIENNPYQKQAADYYTGVLGTPNGQSGLDSIALQVKALEDQRTEALRQNEFQFAGNMNGNYVGNSDYQRAVAKINQGYDTTLTALRAQAQIEQDRLQTANKQAAANALAGLSSQQLSYYAGLAGLSIQQLQEQFQLDAGRAQALKDLATNAGDLVNQQLIEKQQKAQVANG